MFQVCFKCRLPGHKVEECLMNDSDQGTGVCYKCGSQEHTSSTCKAKLPPGTLSSLQSFPFSVLTSCYLRTVPGFCSFSGWYDTPPLQLMHYCSLEIWEQKIRKVPGWVGDVLFWSHHKDSFHQQWSGFAQSLKDWEKWDTLFKVLKLMKVCENWVGSVKVCEFCGS